MELQRQRENRGGTLPYLGDGGEVSRAGFATPSRLQRALISRVELAEQRRQASILQDRIQMCAPRDYRNLISIHYRNPLTSTVHSETHSEILVRYRLKNIHKKLFNNHATIRFSFHL